jgi:hypothetical protein
MRDLIRFVKDKIMITKELVQNVLNDMPDKFTLDEIMQRMYVLHKIELGLEQSEKGETFSMDEAKKKHSKWLKSGGRSKR